MPPLRERGEDIILLAKHFLEEFRRQHRTPVKKFSSQAQQLLLEYPWPGNVRELKNVVERAVLLNGHETLSPQDLSTDRRIRERRQTHGLPVVLLQDENQLSVKMPPQGLDLGLLERQVLSEALGQTSGNLRRAARLVGLSRDAVRYRVKKYHLGRWQNNGDDGISGE
jgi:DNA-binding NtrC family response regulator